MTHLTNKFRPIMQPQAPAYGFPPQGALHRVFLHKPQAFYKCHGALLPRSPKPYHSSLRRRTFLGLEILQELLPTVCVEGARELSLDARYNSHAHSSDPSVGLAQLNLPIRLDCQRILPLFSLSNTPAPTPPPLPPPLSLPSPPPPPPPAPASTSRVPIPRP